MVLVVIKNYHCYRVIITVTRINNIIYSGRDKRIIHNYIYIHFALLIQRLTTDSRQNNSRSFPKALTSIGLSQNSLADSDSIQRSRPRKVIRIPHCSWAALDLFLALFQYGCRTFSHKLKQHRNSAFFGWVKKRHADFFTANSFGVIL